MNNDLMTRSGRCLSKPFSRKGFTLIEMAFVLVIVGILVGLGAQLLPMLVKQNKLKDDRMFVKEVRTAIIGYALATGRLPFASANINGAETSKQTKRLPALGNARHQWQGPLSDHPLLFR